MKRIFTTMAFVLLGISLVNAQTDTTEVSRISRRINDFDIYETANQVKDSIVEEKLPVIETPVEIEKEPVQTKKIATLESSLSDGSYYSVQVAACRTSLSQEYLDYRNYVEVYGSDGWYRYFSSRFLSLQETRSYMYQIRNTTKFKDAFPVRLKDFVKVDLLTGLPLSL